MIKVNLDGLLDNAVRLIGNNGVAFGVRQLQENLKKVRAAHEAGQSKEILDEFFALYVPSQKPKQEQP